MNLKREKTAVLENATKIGYTRKHNRIWDAHFTMPLDDPKNEKIKQLHYVEIVEETENGDEKYIGLFRVMPKRTRKNSQNETVTYNCEHVLGVLIGSTLFKYHQLTNHTTRAVLEYLLEQQHTEHWRLGEVDFTRYFHYSWENESLLDALFSVPNVFDENYKWTWDTQSYPWTLNLKRVDTEPTGKVTEGYNLTGFEVEENPNSLWNRIYPLGSGEGVNQLDIKKVNNGVPYVENRASIEKHGLYERTWSDQRFKVAENLKETAKRMLDIWSEPIVYWSVNAVDLSVLTGLKLDELTEGKIIRVQLDDFDDVDLLIISEKKPDIYGDPTSISLELANLNEDLADSLADTEIKQRINELYSQGATNILNFTYQDNADNNIPAVIPFYVDDDVVNINTAELTFDTQRFRTYSTTTQGGGGVVKSTSSGGSVTESTTSGGGTTRSTTSGGSISKSTAAGGSTTQTSTTNGQSTQTSSGGGDHRHIMFQTTGSVPIGRFGVGATAAGGIGIGLTQGPTQTNISTLTASGNHTHSVTTPAHSHNVSIPSHTHGFEIPNHSHDVTIPNHSHSVTIPNHTHEIDLPNHTHEVKHEIIELSSLPSGVEILVDGNLVPHTTIRANRLDIVDYLRKDSSGRIQRGQHEIEIKPNRLARIEANLILRVFIQSQLGGQF